MKNASICVLGILIIVSSLFQACKPKKNEEIICYEDGICVAPDGGLLLPDGGIYRPGDTGKHGDFDHGDTVEPSDDVLPQADCTCTPQSGTDTDGDCISDSIEDKNGNSDKYLLDTDDDGIPDGCEDRNQDGVHDPNETDPQNKDTDGDGIEDGVEDKNQNGRFESGETLAISRDTDNDGITDGDEDRNHNGIVDNWTDVNGSTDGNCYLPGVDLPGETNPADADTDNDQLPDGVEDNNIDDALDLNGLCDGGETCGWLDDTDCDGLIDGKEDLNRDGNYTADETDPRNSDTDGDGLLDGSTDKDGDGLIDYYGEDINNDGGWDRGIETDPRNFDTDYDGIHDGLEDANLNGKVDAWVDVDNDGCYSPGVDTPGESDPRRRDTDGDGLTDDVEDVTHDGVCSLVTMLDPCGSNEEKEVFSETCTFLKDTDCDGLNDGEEDTNRDGYRGLGETDPRWPDSDCDGLWDSCFNTTIDEPCEESTNPLDHDTDNDGLSDGCEINFTSENCTTSDCSLDPLNEDTDNDGVLDGEEDSNFNCIYESDLGETDPLDDTDPKEPVEGEPNYTEFQVCATKNLKPLSFAESPLVTHDYKLALETEFDAAFDIPTKVAKPYHLFPFGLDFDDNLSDFPNDNDILWGHAFQSPKGVYDPTSTEPEPEQQVVNRDVYGFLYTTTTSVSQSLDNILDQVREQILRTNFAINPEDVLEQVADVPSRPTHDDVQHGNPLLTDFRILRAQRQFVLSFAPSGDTNNPNHRSAISIRNDFLTDLIAYFDPMALGSDELPDNITTQDEVYGQDLCPWSGPCYHNFSIFVSAVQRVDRKIRLHEHKLIEDPNQGQPAIIFLVALTHAPESNEPSLEEDRKHQERKERLEDITGGSALARFDADRKKICENRPQKKAAADMLWVVDDSRSMQQMIGRMQEAAEAAKHVLESNSEIVDFRVAMTTTNPSYSARSQCLRKCDDLCCAQGVNCTTDQSSSCWKNCASRYLGCLKLCPTDCTVTNCANGICECDTCSNPVSDYCPTGTPCIDPASFDQILLADADFASTQSVIPEGTMDKYPLPGGGGTFYFEDSEYLDCKSDERLSSGEQTQFIDTCVNKTGFDSFYGTNGLRKQLLANAGFLKSDPNDTCTTADMDLLYDVDADTPLECVQDVLRTCKRLTESCLDGPTVLVSQMCDLVRTMGGLPCDINVLPTQKDLTSGTRSHSAPESGIRSARRLLTKLLPAYPKNHSDLDIAKLHLRLICNEGQAGVASDENSCPNGTDWECGWYEKCNPLDKKCYFTGACQSCRPGDVLSSTLNCPNGLDEECGLGEYCDINNQCVADCVPIPLVTIFLSDEEDYYFKDECTFHPDNAPGSIDFAAWARSQTDVSQLPELCYDVDGDPTTAESCIEDEQNPLSYCERMGYLIEWPTNYHPDKATQTDSTGFTLQWRHSNAAQCSENPADQDVSCLADPCPIYSGYELGMQQQCENIPMCRWVQNTRKCLNQCAFRVSDPSQRDQHFELCEPDGDDTCEWDQSKVRTNNTTYACTMKRPRNDCQACKRLARTLESIYGDSPGVDSLIGFGQVGPVYAITRDKGKPGAAIFESNHYTVMSEDECAGGPITWGRGDGQAFRDLAIGTLGRTQNICAEDFRPFLQILMADIAALSVPYPLSEAPIAATIKVGISRYNTQTEIFDYFEVPRSRTSGFFYDATTNSIAFRSDPVDGLCNVGTCIQDYGSCLGPNDTGNPSTYEDSEICAAKFAPHVPTANDQIYISYRYWLPVPCEERCGDDQSCVRRFCPDESSLIPCTQDTTCPVLGERCVNSQCQLDCTPGENLDVCICGNCGYCEICNYETGQCELSTSDPCVCDPEHELCRLEHNQIQENCAILPFCQWQPDEEICTLGQRCEPKIPNSCGPRYFCDESCVCVSSGLCEDGFYTNNQVKNCDLAMQCCEDWAVAEVTCPPLSTEEDCLNVPHCIWGYLDGKCPSSDAPCCWAEADACCVSYTPCEDQAQCRRGEECKTFSLREDNTITYKRCSPEKQILGCVTSSETKVSTIECTDSMSCICAGSPCNNTDLQCPSPLEVCQIDDGLTDGYCVCNAQSSCAPYPDCRCKSLTP